jgi:hypothetical protein
MSDSEKRLLESVRKSVLLLAREVQAVAKRLGQIETAGARNNSRLIVVVGRDRRQNLA